MCEYDALPELPYQIDIPGTPNEEEGGRKILLMKTGAFDSYQFAAMGYYSQPPRSISGNLFMHK